MTTKTAKMVLRLPVSLKEKLQTRRTEESRPRETTYNVLDWAPVRAALDEWAASKERLNVEAEEATEQACFHVDAKTDAALRREAERLTKHTGKKWTISKVAAAVLAQYDFDSL